MRTFRKLLRARSGNLVTALLVVATIHLAAGPYNYMYALEVERVKENNIREIAQKMNVDPEFLLNPQGRRSFNFTAFFASLGQKLGFTSETAATSATPENVREEIARVKARYGLVAADTTLSKLAELMEVALSPENLRTKKKGQIKAELQSVLRLVEKDFLPPLMEGLPGSASTRDAQMRVAMGRLRQDVKAVINAPRALDDGNIDATLVKLKDVASGTLKLKGNGQPRWTKDPFPVKDSYRQATKISAAGQYGETGTSNAVSPAVVTDALTPARTNTKVVSNAVASDVAALAAQLGTPAKAFSFVYDNIDFEPYGGVAKGARGALHERRANDWDQALLLRDLLVAQGYDAQIEWGKVELPVARAMNLVGTEDPMQAANLLATAGYDSVALTQNGTPIVVRMTHAWVRAFIPYIPNRGTTGGTPDTWVRMDPSFKRYEYQAGLDINVPWSESEYLQTSTVRPPNDFYADKVWAYIRANNLNCNNLSQVPKTGKVKAANFPFVPATLNARIESLGGLAANPPAAQMQTVTVSVTDPYLGDNMATYSANFADVWGKKLSITFPPATADDAATIARYGGIYNTPAYLVRLKAVISIDDVPVAQGGSVSAGADLSLDLSFREPVLGVDRSHHEITAGETMTEVFDSGRTADSLIAERMERLKAIAAQPVSDAQKDALLTEKLNLVGLRYFQEVDDSFDFATGQRWHRWVKSAFEGLVSQRVNVNYNFVGQAVRITPADRNIDVTRLTVGIIPISSDVSERINVMTLAGLQTSWLEGAIWEEMEAQQGISATKALLLARIAGQTIRTADRSNVEAVLAATNLSSSVESNIRGAVGQGRIAIVPSANIRLNKWVGTGYILRDPIGGSATYPISGGFAGGSSTGGGTSGTSNTLGSESWLGFSPLGEILDELRASTGSSPRAGDGPSTTQSDPVNVATGNMFRSSADFTIPAQGVPVVLSRTYNSRSTYNGPFGYGWTFSYGESVTKHANGSVTYREDDGTEHLFALVNGQYMSPPGKYLTLTANGTEWTVRSKDGLVSSFNAAGNLVSLTDQNDNSVTIQRDAAGLPTSVVDATGRTVLTFTTAAGRITVVTDLTGRQTTYSYDADDLAAVTDTAGKTWTMSYDLSHNMTAFRDPAGNTQSYDYDVDDRLMHHVDAVGAEEYFHYDIAGRNSVVTEKRGGDRLVRYDDLGRATSEVDPAGNLVQASFDGGNNRTAIVDSRGAATTFAYDDSGNVTRKTNPDGGVHTATYDASSRPLTMTDPAGATTAITYDSDGNAVETRRTVAGVVAVTTSTFDATGQMQTMTDPNGHTSTTTWSANGMMATRTDAVGNTTTYTTDAAGRITSVEDAAGSDMTFTYDGRDRILTMTDGHSITTTFAYDDAGNRTSVTTPRGTARYQYDGEGRAVVTIDVLGNRTTSVFDVAGDLIAQTDGRGNTTRFERDLVGRVLKMTDASGGIWTYGYCAAEGSSCSTCGGSDSKYCDLLDPSGNAMKRQFDTMGRVTSTTDSLGHVMQIEYDKAGRKVVQTDARGNRTRYGYDEAGRLLTVTEANGAITTNTYDKNGNRTASKNPNGQEWSFKYDAANRLIEEKDPLGRPTTYTYDALSQIKTKTDAKGQTVTHAYDVARHLTTTYPDGSTESFSYDALGRRTGVTNANVTIGFTYDALDRVATMTNQRYNLVATYQYDAAGNRVKMITPQSTVTYTYDARNRLVTIGDSLFGAFRLAYDGMDRRTELQYPNGVKTSYAYDKAYRLTSMATKDSAGAVLDAWSYQYDQSGNRTSRTDLEGKSETYAYDAVDRIVSASDVNGATERFTYDPAGNRLTQTTTTGTVTYSYDVANQLLTKGGDTFSYDANGNVIRRVNTGGATTYTYDFNNRLTRATGPEGTENSLYAADGSRVDLAGTPIENAQVRVFNDLSGNPILDWGTDNRTWTYRLYGPGMDEPLAEYRRVNNRTTFLHHDALNSVTAVSSTLGRLLYRSTYNVFGKMTRTADPDNIVQTRLGFTSRESSVGGLLYYRARHYDTATGRFMQQDSFRGDNTVPASLHRYTYAHNNPVRYTDPTGHAVWLWMAAILFIFGLVIGYMLRAMLWGPGMQRNLDHGGGSAAFAVMAGMAASAFFGPFGAFLAAFLSCVAAGFAFELAGHGVTWLSDQWDDIYVDTIGCLIGVLIALLIIQLFIWLPMTSVMLGSFVVGVAIGYFARAVVSRVSP